MAGLCDCLPGFKGALCNEGTPTSAHITSCVSGLCSQCSAILHFFHNAILRYTPLCNAIPHCTIFHNATPHYTPQCYTTLQHTILHNAILNYTTLCSTMLHHTNQHNATLHYTPLYPTMLHYTILHYTMLHYTTVQYNQSSTMYYDTILRHSLLPHC